MIFVTGGLYSGGERHTRHRNLYKVCIGKPAFISEGRRECGTCSASLSLCVILVIDQRLYIPDVQKWIKFFGHRHRQQATKSIMKGRPRRTMIPIFSLQKQLDTPCSKAEPKIEVTSQNEDVVKRAEASKNGSKHIKRQAGDKIITTKKVRRTGHNSKGCQSQSETCRQHTLAAKEKVRPVNLLLASLWSAVSVSFQGQRVNINNAANPCKAMFKTLLQYGADAKNSQLETQLFYTDNGDDQSDWNSVDPYAGGNDGVINRGISIAQSKRLSLSGSLMEDVFEF